MEWKVLSLTDIISPDIDTQEMIDFFVIPNLIHAKKDTKKVLKYMLKSDQSLWGGGRDWFDNVCKELEIDQTRSNLVLFNVTRSKYFLCKLNRKIGYVILGNVGKLRRVSYRFSDRCCWIILKFINGVLSFSRHNPTVSGTIGALAVALLVKWLFI